MLVLARRWNESIVIRNTRSGEEIIVKVTALKPSEVKIGIAASANYQIFRQEIIESWMKENTTRES